MANDLTGDFDVVAEFTTLAVDRGLAAMHRCERLLHSMTVRVDDIPPRRFPPGSVIVGAIDTFGEVVVNQRQVSKQGSLYPGSLAATDVVYAGLDVLVNAGSIVIEPLTPSNLQGVAQLQLDPPTIEVPDASGTNLTVRMGVRARYFPDPNTSPAAQFVRGQLVITAPVNQVASQHGNVNAIVVDISGPNVNVNFNALYSNPPLSASDLLGINQLVRNALRTGFLPSNSTLPAEVSFLQFRVAWRTECGRRADESRRYEGSSRNGERNFPGAGDDFGFAISADLIQQKIQTEMQITAPTKTFYSYKFTVDDPVVELQKRADRAERFRARAFRIFA